MSTPGVADTMTIGGYNMLNQAIDSSSMTLIITLNPWDERTTPELSLANIMGTIQWKLQSVNEATAFAFNPPPIQGLSQTGGFQFELQDIGSGDIDTFNTIAQRVIAAGAKYPALTPLSKTFKANYPLFYIDLDRTKAKSLGIKISDIFDTLQAYLGALYVNDFNKFGRIYRVFIQAEKEYRADMADISRLYVRANDGSLVPLSALIKIEHIIGPQTITHYNIFRNIEINGAAAPGYSSGQSIAAMDAIADAILPNDYSYEWTGTALQELKSAGVAPFIFALALAFVFLFLAAQYESWSLPMIIMMAVPLAILGALVAQWWRGLYDDIYCQIGLVMLIGMASKNSILLVEFAKQQQEEGKTAIEAAVMAAHIRPSPDSDDGLLLHPGRDPAGRRHRRGRGQPAFAGDRRLRRHDRCDLSHPWHRAGHLCAGRGTLAARPQKGRSQIGVSRHHRRHPLGDRNNALDIWVDPIQTSIRQTADTIGRAIGGRMRALIRFLILVIGKLSTEFALIAAILSLPEKGSILDRALGGMVAVFHFLFGIGTAYAQNIPYDDVHTRLISGFTEALEAVRVNIQTNPREVFLAFIATYVGFKLLGFLLKLFREHVLPKRTTKKPPDIGGTAGGPTYRQLYHEQQPQGADEQSGSPRDEKRTPPL